MVLLEGPKVERAEIIKFAGDLNASRDHLPTTPGFLLSMFMLKTASCAREQTSLGSSLGGINAIYNTM